jgi:hypothetical protein
MLDRLLLLMFLLLLLLLLLLLSSFKLLQQLPVCVFLLPPLLPLVLFIPVSLTACISHFFLLCSFQTFV